jgi:TolB-like protein
MSGSHGGGGDPSHPTDPTRTSARGGREGSGSGDSEARPASGPAFAAGEVLADRFRIRRFVAQGGMGEVYEAEDLELKEDVALKTIRADVAGDARAVERFRTEIHLARKVTHPSACRIFDVFHHAAADGRDTLFLTMELLRGETLSERLKNSGRLAPEVALPLARQMVGALHAAHRAGVVHRDFKGANVMLVPGPEGERAVVTDFGLARRAAHDESTTTASVSVADHLAGTPAYMAPEQIEGGSIGPATDVYALGIVLYEMVTGARPFAGDSSMGSLLKRLKEPAPSPRGVVPDLDPRWEGAILRCLERDPADRFASAEDVLRVLGGQGVAEGRGEVARRRRRTRVLAAAAAALVAGLAGLAWWRLSRPRPEAPAAGEGAPAVPAKVRRSVAVLGLRNLSGRAETIWLATALGEMLGSEMAAGEALRLVPGERVTRMMADLALGGTEALAAEGLARVRGYLGADLLLHGSYTVLGGRIRLDLRLQEAAQGETLASVSETGSEAELFDMVSRAGGRIREKLGTAPRSEAEAAGVRASLPGNPEAARLFAEGLLRLREFDALAAREALEKAVALDPRHPLTHSALGQAWAVLGYESRARDEARLALDLASSLSREDRLSVEARYRETAREWDKAIELYRSLLLFFPDNLEYGLRLAEAQTSAGRGKDALLTCEGLRRLGPPSGDDARVDLYEAVASRFASESKRGVEAARRAAAKAEAQGARHVLARSRYEEGANRLNLGELDAARGALEEARAMFEKAGDRRGMAGALNSLALIQANQGDLPGARRTTGAALELYRSLGNKAGEALLQGNLGNLRYMEGDFTAAQKMWEATLVTFREIGDKNGAGRMLNNIAAAMGNRGDNAGARARWEDAVTVWREIGYRSGMAATLQNVAKSYQQDGELARAEPAFAESLALFRAMGEKSSLASTLHDHAHLLQERDDLPGARRELEEALALREQAKEAPAAHLTRLALAELALEEGRTDLAEGPARQAVAYYLEKQDGEGEATAQTTVARWALAAGQDEAARAAAARAGELVARSQNVILEAGTAVTRARVRARRPAEAAAAARDLRAFLARKGRALPLSTRLEAELALAEMAPPVEARRLATDLARTARERGFLRVARRAAALAGQPPPRPERP